MADICAFANKVQAAALCQAFAYKQEEIEGKLKAIGQRTILFLDIRQYQGVEIINAMQ